MIALYFVSNKQSRDVSDMSYSGDRSGSVVDWDSALIVTILLE